MARTAGIAQALEEAGGVKPPPRQSELGLGLPAAEKVAGKPGRPLGARGKRTEEFRRELAEGGLMPWQFLAWLYRSDTRELALKLGIKPAEVLAQQRMAAAELLPYTEQQLPRDINVDGKGAMVFAMVDPAKLTGKDAIEQGGPVRLTIEADQGLGSIENGEVGQDGVGHDGSSD